MSEREYLDSSITPRAILDGRKGLTPLQKTDFLGPILGKWIRIQGRVMAISDSSPLGFFGVTIIVPDPKSAIDVFCAFFGDKDRLKLATTRDVLSVEGRVSEISMGSIKLTDCALLNPLTGEPFSERCTAEDFVNSLKAASQAEDEREGPKPPPIPVIAENASGQSGAATNEPAERDVEKKPLPEAALQAWFKAFMIANPKGNQTSGYKSAVGAFPAHHISRKRVRELFPDAAPGRPTRTNH